MITQHPALPVVVHGQCRQAHGRSLRHGRPDRLLRHGFVHPGRPLRPSSERSPWPRLGLLVEEVRPLARFEKEDLRRGDGQ